MKTVPVVPQLQGAFCYNLYKSAMRCRAMLDKALVKLEIIAPQVGILRIIETMGPKNQQELGEMLGIDKASMVKFIDGLQKRKAVKRQVVAKDRRIKLIALTPTGRNILKKATVIRGGVEREFLADLTEDERDSLKAILPKLLRPIIESKT